MKLLLTSIRNKLLLLFIVFSVIPMGFVASHVYRHAESTLRADTVEHLNEIAAHKALEITRFFEQSRLNLISAREFVNFRTNIPIMTRLARNPADPRFTAAKRLIDIQLIKFAEDHRLGDIDIIGMDGRIVYSTDMDHDEGESYAGTALFEEGKRGIYFSDVLRKRGEGTGFVIHASAPLFDLKDRKIGVIAFELDTKPFFTLIQDSTGLGRTGETLIGKRIDDQVVFLNPLRHDPDAALKRTVRLDALAGAPMVLAATGQTGSGLHLDYRGRKVLAAWRYIPAVRWGIVAKIDASEAFAPIAELREDMLTAGALAMFFGICFSLWLAHSMTRPIRALREGAHQLGHGNLEFRVREFGSDEIGSLARTFNHMAANLKEITESRDQIRHQANHDPLTGLPNRLLLEDRLEQALIECRREQENLALMFLDLDGFKPVNDTYGHDMGDFLLKQVAIRLLQSVRQYDTVARLGGDEFVIILRKVKDQGNIPIIAAKVLNAFREEFLIEGQVICVGASIGISLYPGDGDAPDQLMQLADEAMYAAKKGGRNAYRLAISCGAGGADSRK